MYELITFVCAYVMIAVTIKVFWDWFVVPLGVKSITVPHVMALRFFLALIQDTFNKKITDDDVAVILLMLIFLIIGKIYHCLM